MAAVLIFLVLPALLIILSFFVRPLVRRGRGEETAYNQMISGGVNTLFGGHGLHPDPVNVPEETEPVRFSLPDQRRQR